MDWSAILTTVLSAAAVAAIGAITPLVVKGLQQLVNWLKSKTDNENLKTLIGAAGEIVNNAVIVANQTAVETMKKEGTFNAESAKKISEDVIESVKKSLTEDQVQAIAKTTALTLEEWIKQQVEVAVNNNKS